MFLLLQGAPGALAWEFPVLPVDPAVTSGRLPDGIGYVIVSDSAVKGLADVVLLQRLCQTPETTCFRDVPLYRGADVLDSLLSRVFSIIRESIEEDPSSYGTDNQTVIICGDVKPEKVVQMLGRCSDGVPASRSTAVASPYVWRGSGHPSWEMRQNPDGTAQVRMTTSLRRMDEALMGTVVPVVSMRMDKMLEVILRKSLESTFERLSIPYSSLSFTPKRSWETCGDEKYTLSVKVSAADADRTMKVMKSICSELAEGNIGKLNYSVVRAEVMSAAFREAHRHLTNSEQAGRCVSSVLYGTSLHTPMSAYRFFADRDVADSVQLRGTNRRAAEIFAGTPKEEMGQGVRMITVNKADTLSFAGPSRKPVKVSSTMEEYVSKGTVWSFSNGMRVVYKRMDTRGLLHYSMVFRLGASYIQDAPAGESAFYADMFRCADVGTLSGYDFHRLQEACGVTMDCQVGLYETSLSGQAHTGDLSMLLKQLICVTAGRHPSEKASAYAAECARLAIRPSDELREMLYDKMHPDYIYTPFKVEKGLTASLQENAGRLFERAFSHCEESTLILVGDREESEVLKVLRRYVGQFRTGSGAFVNTAVRFTTIAGKVELEGPGPRGVAVEMSAPLIYTADNYFAVKVLQEAVTELLSGYAAKVSLHLYPRPVEHLEMRIEALGDVSEDELMLALEYMASGDEEVYSRLGDWRTVVQNRIEWQRTSPQYWVDAVRTRYIDAKDVAGKSREKISSVSKERLMAMASALKGGGRVVYHTSPEK